MVKFLLQRPIAVLMAFTACFIVGLVTYFSLPVSLLPDIAIPQITIQVTGENSSARELENTVVTPVRRQLLQVAGLREIKSETRDGAGVIRLQYDFEKRRCLSGNRRATISGVVRIGGECGETPHRTVTRSGYGGYNRSARKAIANCSR